MIKESNNDYIEIHLESTTDMKNEISKTQSQVTFAQRIARKNSLRNLGIKKIFFLIIISIFLKSCFRFEGEKIEINYKNKTIKVLSNDYVIESVLMGNYQTKYYFLKLKDTLKGDNMINFKIKPTGYNLIVDSLDYYCSEIPNMKPQELWIKIRKRGFSGSKNGGDYKEIQCFDSSILFCNSSLIDTIVANNPYK